MNRMYDLLLDVGGTGIKGGYFQAEEKSFSKSYDFPANSEKDKEEILRHFSSLCRQLWDQVREEEKSLRSLRMAFPGPFDYEKGISLIKGLSKYESLYGVSIPDEMIALGKKENYSFLPREKAGFKFVNDVEAYARGVMCKRKLYQGYRVLYLCIGTGAGSAYSIDGRISTKESEGIPEKGWVYPVPFLDSVIDDYISVRGINKLAKGYCNRILSPLELSEMAVAGNSQAVKAYEEFGKNLNTAFLTLLREFKANAFVIGGNISRSSGLFLSPLKESCKEFGIDIIIESNTSEMVMMGLMEL